MLVQRMKDENSVSAVIMPLALFPCPAVSRRRGSSRGPSGGHEAVHFRVDPAARNSCRWSRFERAWDKLTQEFAPLTSTSAAWSDNPGTSVIVHRPARYLPSPARIDRALPAAQAPPSRIQNHRKPRKRPWRCGLARFCSLGIDFALDVSSRHPRLTARRPGARATP